MLWEAALECSTVDGVRDGGMLVHREYNGNSLFIITPYLSFCALPKDVWKTRV